MSDNLKKLHELRDQLDKLREQVNVLVNQEGCKHFYTFKMTFATEVVTSCMACNKVLSREPRMSNGWLRYPHGGYHNGGYVFNERCNADFTNTVNFGSAPQPKADEYELVGAIDEATMPACGIGFNVDYRFTTHKRIAPGTPLYIKK